MVLLLCGGDLVSGRVEGLVHLRGLDHVHRLSLNRVELRPVPQHPVRVERGKFHPLGPPGEGSRREPRSLDVVRDSRPSHSLSAPLPLRP